MAANNICAITTKTNRMGKTTANPFEYYTNIQQSGCDPTGSGRGLAMCSSAHAMEEGKRMQEGGFRSDMYARSRSPFLMGQTQNFGSAKGTPIIGNLQGPRSRVPDLGQLVTSRDNHETSTIGAAMVPNAVYPNAPHMIPMRTQAN